MFSLQQRFVSNVIFIEYNRNFYFPSNKHDEFKYCIFIIKQVQKMTSQINSGDSNRRISRNLSYIKQFHSYRTSTVTNNYLFSNSPYAIYMLSNKTQQPILKINFQQNILFFEGYAINQQIALVLVQCFELKGSWSVHMFQNNNGWQYIGYVEGCHLSDNKPIGLHLLQYDIKSAQCQLLWVFENGVLQFIKISIGSEPQKKLTTVPYVLNSNKPLIRYKGPTLLELSNENKITSSTYCNLTNTLLISIIDFNSELFSIYQFNIDNQHHQVLAGKDCLLSLRGIIKGIYFINHQSQMTNDKQSILICLRNGFIMWKVDKSQNIMKNKKENILSVHRISSNQFIYLSKNSQGKGSILNKLQIFENIKITQIYINIQDNQLYYLVNSHTLISLQESKSKLDYYSITTKLQLQKHSHSDTQIIISNQFTNIISAELHFSDFYNFLVIQKKVGRETQKLLVGNSTVVTQKEVYVHNILLKMAQIMYYKESTQGVDVWITSPILGTIQLFIQMNSTKQESSPSCTFEISSINKGNLKFIKNQESLALKIPSEKQTQQVTSTSLIYQGTKFQISKLFQGNIDYAIAGCFCGYFACIAVEKQLHIFSFQKSKNPKRVHIHCFDSDIKSILDLNNVNTIGILLWSNKLQILQICETELLNKNQYPVELGSNLYIHTDQLIINTVKHCCTILPGYFILCSSDSLHLYQPDKTTIQVYPISMTGQCCYPVINLGSSDDCVTVLTKWRSSHASSSSYRLLKVPKKQLVKNMNNIKYQIEQIIAFPQQQQDKQQQPSSELLFMILKENNVLLVYSNKFVVCILQNGIISLGKNKIRNHLDRWMQSNLSRSWEGKLEFAKKEKNIQSQETIRNSIQMTKDRYIFWNQQEIWYGTYSDLNSQLPGNQKLAHPISYFSMPNNEFLEFRNNLSVEELENQNFMKIFAKKLPIKSVCRISSNIANNVNQNKFAVLYDTSIVIVEVGSNQMLSIQQEIYFKDYHASDSNINDKEYIKITDFIGYYDKRSLYLKDGINHRMYALKYNSDISKYRIQFIEELEVDEQIIGIHRVQNWKTKTRKSTFEELNNSPYEKLIVKRDGQLIIGDSLKPIYL